jgi:hypothetical protein
MTRIDEGEDIHPDTRKSIDDFIEMKYGHAAAVFNDLQWKEYMRALYYDLHRKVTGMPQKGWHLIRR